MSELGKKVPKDSDWLFGDNIVSTINQTKAKQELTTWVLPETAKKRTEQQQLPAKPAKETLIRRRADTKTRK